MPRTLLAAVLLAAALVLLAAPVLAGGGVCHEPITDAAGAAVEMRRICFSPTVLRIAPGETVTWTNADEVPHVVVGTGWGSGSRMQAGESVTHRFDRPGIYAYTCNLHYGMNGAVVVGDGVTRGGGPAGVSLIPAGGEVVPAGGQTPGEGIAPALLAAAVAGALAAGGAGYGVAVLRRRDERRAARRGRTSPPALIEAGTRRPALSARSPGEGPSRPPARGR